MVGMGNPVACPEQFFPQDPNWNGLTAMRSFGGAIVKVGSGPGAASMRNNAKERFVRI